MATAIGSSSSSSSSSSSREELQNEDASATAVVQLPEGDLTCDRIDEWIKLNDRSKICWALQTECRVRLEKVKQRETFQQISKVLQDGNYLFEIYPHLLVRAVPTKNENIDNNHDSIFSSSLTLHSLDNNEQHSGFFKNTSNNKKNKKSQTCRRHFMEQDWYDFYHRKCSELFRSHRSLDKSWESISPLIIRGHVRDENNLFDKKQEQAENNYYEFDDEEEEEDDDDDNKNQNNCHSDSNDETSKNEDNEEDFLFSPAPVPPNMFYFRIILEGYIGYVWPHFHSPDESIPRGAVMGGAVVAALTAWRDPQLINIFRYNGFGNEAIMRSLLLQQGQTEQREYYTRKRQNLVHKINDYFVYKTNQSCFSDGDVDVFLQASPLTRNLLQHLQIVKGIDLNILNHISEYMGGLNYVQDDLHRMMRHVVKATGTDPNPYLTGLVHALASNGISFQYAKHTEGYDSDDDESDAYYYRYTYKDDDDDDDDSTPESKENWIRTTQTIMLKPQADLLGGLLDFDISVVSCAYDGTGVYVTPRAALGLITLSFVVTPFILCENRNRQRIVKYWKRGFTPYMVDPYCFHTKQCDCTTKNNNNEKSYYSPRESLLVFERTDPKFEFIPGTIVDENDISRAVVTHKDQRQFYRASDRLTNEQINDVYNFQENYGIHLCCGENHEPTGFYSFVLFEHEEGDATKFFEVYNKWDDELKAAILEIPPKSRMACAYCRTRYLMHRVMKSLPRNELLGLDSKEDNFLHDEPSPHGWSESGSAGYYNWRQEIVNFYCGPAFDSRLAKKKDYHVGHVMSNLHSRERMEKVRYEIKYGNSRNVFESSYMEINHDDATGSSGYQKRFVYDPNLDWVFEKAWDVLFPPPSRSTVGLNPERFIGRCQYCNEWLVGCEFNTTVCEQCSCKKKGKIA